MPDATRFVSWIGHHGRSADISRALGIEPDFIDGGSGFIGARYLRQWRQTRRLITRTEPSAVIVMQPPAPALLAVLSTRAGRRAMLIGDLHTGTFEDRKWAWALPSVLKVLRKRGAAVVTNEPLAERVRARGGTVLVLHDLIEQEVAPSSPSFDDIALEPLHNVPYVLVPLAYANDEPLDALLEAVAATPTITWVLTGRAPARLTDAATPNARFTGFVSNADFQRLLGGAGAVAALTTREFTMQRAGYEALAHAVPLVTTATETLSDYFGDSAVLIAPTAAGIAAGAREALSRGRELRERLSALRSTRQAEQEEALESLRALLASSARTTRS